jgi:hypothetical protein
MLTTSVAMRCSACALATLLMVPVLPAERILRQDLNGSMLAEQALEGRRIDWKSIVKEMKPVFRNNKRDEFIVYETDGKGLTLLSKPNPNCMCWNTFKEAMKACGPRGTMCIGMYNFNFPIKTGSSTLKGKIGLFLAQDPKEMQKTIGSPIGVMRVQLPTINDVWQPLQKQLSAASMHPSMKSEMGSAEEIDSHGPEWIWGEFARKATRNDQATVDSFLDDLTAKNERVGARGCNVLEERDDGAAPVHDPSPVPSSTPARRRQASAGPRPQPGSIGGNVDIKRMVKQELASAKSELTATLKKEFQGLAASAAQKEVGMALRSLGTKVGDAIRDIGQKYIRKSA